MSFADAIGGSLVRRFLIIPCIGIAVILGLGPTVFAPSNAYAQSSGDLVVAPTRIVFEGRTRSAQLGLVNKGSGSATYRISVINMRMGENGQLTEIAEPEPGQQFADRLFRYSPRQVTLDPGATQAIRLLLRKPKDLEPGEYRSHLMMRAIPDTSSQSIDAPTIGSAVQLIPVFGIAIPVIVRHGDVDYGSAISDIELIPANETNQLNRLRFNLERTGNRSSFGDLVATLKDGSSDVVLAQVMRIAVYTPNDSRVVEMPLRVPEGVSLAGKTVNLTFKTIADEGAKLMAEGTIQLP